MKLVTYDTGNKPRAGIAVGGMIVDVEKAGRTLGSGHLAPETLALLQAEDGLQYLRKTAVKAETLVAQIAAGKARRPAWIVPEERVHLGPPVPNPEKVICLGLNYLDHIKEQEGKLQKSVDRPENPIIFSKFASTLTGPYDPIKLPPEKLSCKADYEVELAVVIGRTARNVRKKEAMDYIAGYMVLDDVSARDCQFADKQWVRAKSFDSYAPCGPWLVTADEVPNPHRLRLWTILNGEKMQDSSTRNLLFKIPEVIEFLARGMTLRPGDIISTGTPPGVGAFRDPQVYLKPGDVVECGVEGIGTICNTVEK